MLLLVMASILMIPALPLRNYLRRIKITPALAIMLSIGLFIIALSAAPKSSSKPITDANEEGGLIWGETSDLPETTKAPAETTKAPAVTTQEWVEWVWIPTNGGTKYHSQSTCSNMKKPSMVTKEEAKTRGFTACRRCY